MPNRDGNQGMVPGLELSPNRLRHGGRSRCPGGKHNPDRAGYRHGTGTGPVTLGGRRGPVTWPRVRAADGSGELHLPSYDLFSCTEVLGQLAAAKRVTAESAPSCGPVRCRKSAAEPRLTFANALEADRRALPFAVSDQRSACSRLLANSPLTWAWAQLGSN